MVALRRALGAAVGFYGGGIVTGRFPQFPPLVDRSRRHCRRRGSDCSATRTRRSRSRTSSSSAAALHARRSTPRSCATPAPATASTATSAPDYHPEAAADAWKRTLALVRHAPRWNSNEPTSSAAIAAIDAANAEDPTMITVRGRTGPKEIVHAELVTEWVRDLAPDASEALLLAARGHHLRRWTVPRSSYPAGRAGYLRWRRDLHEQHARELGEILDDAGYDADTVARVQTLVRKHGPRARRRGAGARRRVVPRVPRDPAHRRRGPARPDKLTSVAREDRAQDEPGRGRRDRARPARRRRARGARSDALGPAAAVHRYLDALGRRDWDALAGALAPDVERIGPYRDVVRGRDAYADVPAHDDRRAVGLRAARRTRARRRARPSSSSSRDRRRRGRAAAHRRGRRVRRRRRPHHARRGLPPAVSAV